MYKSPYLKHTQRLPEILTAIQVMGSYKWDMLEITDWQERLGDPNSADNKTMDGGTTDKPKWDAIFQEHPEFFQKKEKDGKQYWVLTWRLAYDPYYDPDEQKEYTLEQVKGLPRPKKLGRKPLEPAQITTLLTTAIELQVRAAAFEERRRWLITAAISFISAVIVVILGVILK